MCTIIEFHFSYSFFTVFVVLLERMEEEDNRQNARIQSLEKQTETITELAISVKELAASVKQLAESEKKHDDKLEELSARDGERWRNVVGYVITVIVGIVIGFIFKQIGM